MCEKCLYRKNCQFLAKRKPCKVEDCTAFKSEKELIADTVLKYSEKVYQLIFGFVGEKLSEQDKDYITVRLGQIAKEMSEGE